MKKILFVINTMGRAGAEMALLELLRSLKSKEIELSLFVLTGQGEMLQGLPEGVHVLNRTYDDSSVHTAEGKKHLMKTVCKAMVRRGTGIRLFPYLVKQLFAMLRKGKVLPDKLLWRVLSDGAQRFKEEYDLAVAYIEGGSTYYVKDHVKAKKKAAFFHVDYSMAGYTRSLDKECYTAYDKVFPVSDEVKAAFLEAYPECREKTEVFHNLINRKRILDMAELPGGFTDDYNGYRILTVGRLMEQKDFAQSIRAMKLLKEQGIRARWYILGEGEQRGELERLIQELGLEQEFFLPGAVENPYCYMKQADIYVHATRFEGKSIAIQEAQVLGRPILVSDCSGNREQVQHGVDGLLCDMTPEAICEGIRQLLAEEDKRKNYGNMAAKRHTTEQKETEKLLSLLLGK
ncbi:MAG: glycosyltransferase [Lachnospiraceae bacterium]|nr:glycosyltransferase [Lachnospiraceae bacterium]